MEKRDIYDLYGHKTGKITDRWSPLGEGEFCRTVCVCVFNSKGELLIQKRSADKKLWPGMWDVSAAGAAQVGENGQQAAERELLEEMGITADFSNVRPRLTTYFRDGFSDVFFLVTDLDPNGLTVQTEEVTAVRWASQAEILEMLQNKEFCPYMTSYINILFDYLHNSNSFILE